MSIRESDLQEINGLIAKREWIKKFKMPLAKADHSMLYYIRMRLEELGVGKESVQVSENPEDCA